MCAMRSGGPAPIERRRIGAGDRVRVVAIDGITLEVEPEQGAARDYRDRRVKTPEG